MNEDYIYLLVVICLKISIFVVATTTNGAYVNDEVLL